MKTLCLLILCALCATLRAQNVPTEIKLTNGFVMHQSTVVAWETDAITVKYVGGTVPVKLKNIDPAQRELFEKAMADGIRNQQQHYSTIASNQSSDEEHEKAFSEKQERQQAQEEAKRDDIKRAVFNHELRVGMTTDEVRQSFGSPNSTSETRGTISYDNWTYIGRGKGVNSYGTPKDRHLSFKNGLLTSWQDW